MEIAFRAYMSHATSKPVPVSAMKSPTLRFQGSDKDGLGVSSAQALNSLNAIWAARDVRKRWFTFADLPIGHRNGRYLAQVTEADMQLAVKEGLLRKRVKTKGGLSVTEYKITMLGQMESGGEREWIWPFGLMQLRIQDAVKKRHQNHSQANPST